MGVTFLFSSWVEASVHNLYQTKEKFEKIILLPAYNPLYHNIIEYNEYHCNDNPSQNFTYPDILIIFSNTIIKFGSHFQVYNYSFTQEKEIKTSLGSRLFFEKHKPFDIINILIFTCSLRL